MSSIGQPPTVKSTANAVPPPSGVAMPSVIWPPSPASAPCLPPDRHPEAAALASTIAAPTASSRLEQRHLPGVPADRSDAIPRILNRADPDLAHLEVTG